MLHYRGAGADAADHNLEAAGIWACPTCREWGLRMFEVLEDVVFREERRYAAEYGTARLP